MANFEIDGVEIPTPSTYEFSIEELSSEQTGRTMDGVMHKDVIAVKDTYSCTWKKLSWQDMSRLLNAIDGKQQFNFTHVDPRIPNQWVTYPFYVGERTGTALNIKDPKRTWTDLSLKFIRI